jgi:diguanylate cyclase
MARCAIGKLLLINVNEAVILFHPSFAREAKRVHFCSTQTFSHTYDRTVTQGRIGLVVGTILYLLFGLFDRWSIPMEHHVFAWTIRMIALIVPVSIFILTFTSHFRKASHFYLASLGFAANIGFLFIFALIPIDKLALFYPSIALTTVATYFLVGTRFIYALSAELTIFLAYNMLFINLHGIATPMLLKTLLIQDFFLLSANVIGGAAGYMQELQNRNLFLRETELEHERLHHLNRSLHDPLTQLPNRDLLHDRIQQALAQSHRDNSTHAAFYIDLDGFKAINDHHGHEVGDKVLQTVAAQLSITARDTDTVARLGGDEFFVLCQSIGGTTEAKQQALRLLNAIEKISSMGTVTDHALSASIGICMLPYSGNTVTDIVKRADKAMYKAKKSGGQKYVLSSPRAAAVVH